MEAERAATADLVEKHAEEMLNLINEKREEIVQVISDIHLRATLFLSGKIHLQFLPAIDSQIDPSLMTTSTLLRQTFTPSEGWFGFNKTL